MSGETKSDQVYVVQVRRGSEGPWSDITTVTVPARTKRSTVIKLAFKDAGIEAEKGTAMNARALDVDNAEVHEAQAVQAPAEWVI